MNKEERYQYILSRLAEDSDIPLASLAREIGMSYPTIKKDVRFLLNEGIIDKEEWAKRNPHGHPDARENVSKATREAMHRPEIREKVLVGLKKVANDPVRRAKHGAMMRELWKTPEYRNKVVQAHKDKWKNDEGYRSRQEEVRRNPEWRKKLKAILNRPEIKRKVSQAGKRHWKNPKYRENLRQHRIRTAGKIGEAARKHWRDPEYRRKHLSNPKFGVNIGSHHSTKAGKVYYRSSYELSAFIILDNDKDVITYEVETVAIPYIYKNINRTYIIDLKVSYRGGRVLHIEIKPKNQVNTPQNQAKIQAAIKRFGDDFTVWTEEDLYS